MEATMKRGLAVPLSSIALSGCGAGGVVAKNDARATCQESVEDSQSCVGANPNDAEACESLRLIMETDERASNNLAAAANIDPVVASSFQSPNSTRSILGSASDHLTRNQARNNSGSSIAGSLDLQVEGTDDDSDLIALGKQFEEIAANVRNLCNSASPDVHLALVEATLARLEPIEIAIMATPARTVSGLGVKARHAAYVLAEYWDVPIDRIEWDARAVRLLIEAVCEKAGVSLPFGDRPTS
jgi:hypothetical protein